MVVERSPLVEKPHKDMKGKVVCYNNGFETPPSSEAKTEVVAPASSLQSSISSLFPSPFEGFGTTYQRRAFFGLLVLSGEGTGNPIATVV